MNPYERLSRHTTAEQCAQIVVLAEDGVNQQDIANGLDLHQSTVSRVLRRFHETGEYSRRPGQGRRRTTTAQRDRFLLLQSLRHRTLTAPALQVMTLGRYQFQISANTIRRRLAEHDLRPRIPARGPQLTAVHRRVRLLFTQNHVDWELDQRRLVMFSDESRFCLDQSDRRVRVNRCSGERYAQCNIIPKANFGRGSVMV
jgi:transposase